MLAKDWPCAETTAPGLPFLRSGSNQETMGMNIWSDSYIQEENAEAETLRCN